MQTYYLPDQAWSDLTDFIARHAPLREALGIKPNPATDQYGFDEMAEVLGGQFDIWPEWARVTIEKDLEKSPSRRQYRLQVK